MPAAGVLPVDSILPELAAALAHHGCAVLHAPPGAGKTTRVPPELARTTGGRILVLEPRRVAARAAARRIAEERGWRLGQEVGWWIRFERRFRADTRVLFVTEGLLLRWLERDPFLDRVSTVIFDEFHERALASDLALALVRQVRREARPDLRLVVMSATLDVERVASFLDAAPVVRSEGRLHPVETRLLALPDERPLERQVVSAARQALRECAGDLLVFLPGRREIERAAEALTELAGNAAIELVPLYGDLPIEAQDAALRRGARRRIVLATNVAETSVTVEGVTAVVDSGWVRQLRHDPASGLDRLDTIRVSRASAEQRAGRAGREAPGLCLRLWSAADDLALRPFDLPEVKRVDLAGALLALAAFGESDAGRFGWFEAPDPARLESARRQLLGLGALDRHGLTAIGRRLAALPLAPRLGRLVLEGERRGVAADAALVAALLSDRDPLRASSSAQRADSRSDLIDRLEALDPRRHGRLYRAQRQILDTLKHDEGASGTGERESTISSSRATGDHREGLLRAIAAAFLDRLCRRRERRSERALMVGGRGVRLASASTVREAELFVAVELGAGRPGERSEARVRLASAVEREWLPEDLVHRGSEVYWNGERQRVAARRVERCEDLVLDEREIPVEDDTAAAALLVDHASRDPEGALALDRPEVAGLLDRLRFLARARPDLGFAEPGRRALVELLPALAYGLRSFAELRRVDLSAVLLGQLGAARARQLEELAPERLSAPSGSRLRIDYSDPESPVLAARIQELFGLGETPRLAGGRVPVLLHLLAPNGRPQQVTNDLASFWRNTYPIVRKELAGRYPKHAWPEDPTTARPERRPRRRAPG